MMVKIDLLLFVHMNVHRVRIPPLFPQVPPLKTFQKHLQNCPITPNTKNSRKHMLFSFRAKRFNSYYDTAVNTNVRHSVKYKNVFKHVFYQSLSHLSFFHLSLSRVLTIDSVFEFSLRKHINTRGIIVNFLVR